MKDIGKILYRSKQTSFKAKYMGYNIITIQEIQDFNKITQQFKQNLSIFCTKTHYNVYTVWKTR